MKFWAGGENCSDGWPVRLDGWKQRGEPANFHQLPVVLLGSRNRCLMPVNSSSGPLLFSERPPSYSEVVMQENERTKLIDRSAERLGLMRRYL